MIRVARPVKDLYAKCMNLSQSMYYTLGREPTLGELAAELSVTPEEIAFAMDAARMPISISTPVAGEGGKELTVGDSITTGDNTAGVVNKVVLREMLSGLPASERQIIVMRYLMEKTQSEVAKMMGISQVQVSRMESVSSKKCGWPRAGGAAPVQATDTAWDSTVIEIKQKLHCAGTLRCFFFCWR